MERAEASPIYGCIEAGGTKFVIGVVNGQGDVLAEARIGTTTPEETLRACVDWLDRAQDRLGPLTALGVASFGPVELDPASASWGYITSTPKDGWSHTDLAGRFARAFGLPVGFDTDVNGAARAEALWGAGRDQKISAYLTIGTGIGGGVMVDGAPLQGLSHPEIGHFRPPRHADDLHFSGVCPFHGDCHEGLASGPAIQARWGCELSDLPPDHPAHDIIAWYLAHLTIALQAMLEPGRIIMGGGVMETPGLLAQVRQAATRLGGGYFKGRSEDVIVPPMLGKRLGLLAGLALALDAEKAPYPARPSAVIR